MVTILILSVPVGFILGCATALCGVRLGLRWRAQLSQGQSPDFGISEFFKEKPGGPQGANVLFDEWVNGEGEK